MVERVGPMRAAGHLASGGRREMGCSPGPPVSCCGGVGREDQDPKPVPAAVRTPGAPYANPPLSTPSLPSCPGKRGQE